jgi:hypothetical protein
MKHTPFDPFAPPDFLRRGRYDRKGAARVTRVTPEIDFFTVCGVCGQAFDTRELDEVEHHGLTAHDPVPTN